MPLPRMTTTTMPTVITISITSELLVVTGVESLLDSMQRCPADIAGQREFCVIPFLRRTMENSLGLLARELHDPIGLPVAAIY
jgi:hypothetical protein